MISWRIDPLLHWPDVPNHRLAGFLGFIPEIIPGVLQAKSEIHVNYAHGGGWHPMDGFTMNDQGVLAYSGDPDMFPIAEGKNDHGETIRVYEHGWVSVSTAEGFDVTRMD